MLTTITLDVFDGETIKTLLRAFRKETASSMVSSAIMVFTIELLDALCSESELDCRGYFDIKTPCILCDEAERCSGGRYMPQPERMEDFKELAAQGKIRRIPKISPESKTRLLREFRGCERATL